VSKNERAIPGEKCDCGPWVLTDAQYAVNQQQPHQFVQHSVGTNTWVCRFCLRFAGQRGAEG
jgi:hypothetical protein